MSSCCHVKVNGFKMSTEKKRQKKKDYSGHLIGTLQIQSSKNRVHWRFEFQVWHSNLDTILTTDPKFLYIKIIVKDGFRKDNLLTW